MMVVQVVEVIANLIHQTIVISEIMQPLLGGILPFIKSACTQFAASRHKRGRLFPNDIYVQVLGSVCPPLQLCQLDEFALTHGHDSLRQDTGSLMVIHLVQQTHHLCQVIVATKYGRGIAPTSTHRRLPSSHIVVIHNIVVHQGGVVQHLDSNSQLDVPLGGCTASLCREQQEKRAQLFTRELNLLLRHFGQSRNLYVGLPLVLQEEFRVVVSYYMS